MTKKRRRFLFYGLLLLFPLLGAAIVLYAQGWRLDWETFKFQKVGAIYIKSSPENANIHLNGAPVKNESGILDRGTFIGSLFPKNYLLTLNADGYHTWEEHITVKPSLVSEIKYAVLIPKTLYSITTSSIKNFWIVDQEPLIQNEQGLLWKNKKLAGIRVIGWTKNFKKILTEDEKNKIYFINDISTDTLTTVNLNSVFSAKGPLRRSFSETSGSASGGKNLGVQPSGLQKVFTDPASDNDIILQTADSIFMFDTRKSKITNIVKSTSTILTFAASPSWFAWATFDSKNNRSRLTLYGRSYETRLDNEIFDGKNFKLDFRNDNELGILQDDGVFYLVSTQDIARREKRIGERPTRKIASNVKDFSFSPNEKLVAVLENNSIEIFSSDSENTYWRFRLPDNDTIERLEWYRDANHLFVVYPQEMKFLDLNDKAIENFLTIISGNSARYDESSNKLYFLKNNALWSLTFP